MYCYIYTHIYIHIQTLSLATFTYIINSQDNTEKNIMLFQLLNLYQRPKATMWPA